MGETIRMLNCYESEKLICDEIREVDTTAEISRFRTAESRIGVREGNVNAHFSSTMELKCAF